MKANRNTTALALMGVLALTTAGIASDRVPANSTSAPGASQRQERQASSTQERSMAAENFLRRFAGQWKGRLEMRNDDRASISIVSVSSRFDAKNSRFESVTQGFAFGKPFDEAEMFGLGEKGEPSQYWWTSNFEEKGSTWVWAVGEDGRSIVGKGREHRGSLATRYEHVMRYVDDDQYEVEWFNISPKGERARVAWMTLTRLNREAQADASEKFDDGSFESWSTMIKGAWAQVEDKD